MIQLGPIHVDLKLRRINLGFPPHLQKIQNHLPSGFVSF